jgi:4-amino-4-deoxy-L-arabinose transferase-like glycosyltransferase
MMEAGVMTAPRPMAHARGRAATAVLAAAPLVLITVAGAVLRLWAFGKVGGNPFYDAAARSMSLSWHNFFFGAFEPSAQVSIDKAPADLWMQVAAVKLFGFSGVSTRLPEVTAGVLAIPLLYDLVRRLFGRTPGLAAAAALAVLPTAILTAHSDTMDSVMMALDVLAAWLVVVGAQRRSVWPVVAAGAVVGVAFNVKLFQALIFLPALVLLMALALDLSTRRRLLALGGSLVAFVVVSLSWIVTASMTPLSGRPWPIGSTDGSIWSVVFGFNGLDRLKSTATPAALKLDPPGALRFLHDSGHGYLTTVGTMLVAAAVLGAVALVVALSGRPRFAQRRTLPVAGAVFFGVWLLLGTALLSHMQRFQPRYLEAVTPAIAAVVGIGVGTLAQAPRRHARAALALAAAGVAVAGLLLAHPPVWAVVVALAGAVGCVAVVAAGRLPRGGAAPAACALCAVLAVPASAALTVARQHQSDAGLPSALTDAQVASLSSYLIAHQGSARYEMASPTVFRAAPLIVRDARPVLMLTSINGQALMTPARLAALVANGQVRYALLGRSPCAKTPDSTQPCAPVVRWAMAHRQDVSAAAGLPRFTLYALRAGHR